jgi:hypothetical protein
MLMNEPEIGCPKEILGPTTFWTQAKVPGHPDAVVSHRTAQFPDKPQWTHYIVIAEPTKPGELRVWRKLFEYEKANGQDNRILCSDVIHQAVNSFVEEEIERLRDAADCLCIHKDELRLALQDLIDEQNGPPLIRHQHGWAKAMVKANMALGQHEPADFYRRNYLEK